MLDFHKAGVPTFDYGNNIRQMAKDEGVADAFAFPGFVPAYIRPLFCRGIGPFRWVALSGDPEDIYRTDAKVKALLPDNVHLHAWLDMARKKIKFQGLPARICWVGLGDRHRLGLAFNQMVADGELKAPIVIGRDHLDSGSVASPNRETEAMKDGSDAVSDWPILNALLNCASGATWVSFHHGGGVGMGYSQHAGMVIVADGTPEAARGSSACSGTIRRQASCDMPTRDTPPQSSALEKRAWIYPRCQAAKQQCDIADLIYERSDRTCDDPTKRLFRPRRPRLRRPLRNQSKNMSEIGVAECLRCKSLNGASRPIRSSGLKRSQYGTFRWGCPVRYRRPSPAWRRSRGFRFRRNY